MATDPRSELVLLAMLDHPHAASDIAEAFAAGRLDDLLAGSASDADPDPDKTPE